MGASCRKPKYSRLESYDETNLDRVYKLVSFQLVELSKKMNTFYYSECQAGGVIRMIELLNIQVSSVYIRRLPVYDDFFPSPPYSKDERPEISSQEKEIIFFEYLKEVVLHWNDFCNEYTDKVLFFN